MPDDKKMEIEEPQESLGKYWAAIKEGQVIGLISMRVPKEVDFEAYRLKAGECLSLLGVVKAGDVISEGEKNYFLQRQTHSNRSKNVRPQKRFLLKKAQHAI